MKRLKLGNMQFRGILCLILLGIFSCKNKKDLNKSRVDVLPFYNEATFTPRWIDPNDSALDTFHKISSYTLINQEGEKVTENTFDGKIYVADFFFTTCPGICPKMTANMSILQDEFEDDTDILLLSHSVTPDRDSVPVLKNYAEQKGINAHKWHLVTGSQEDIYRLGRRNYFVEEDLGVEKDLEEFLHTENFLLVDRNRHIRGIYNGLNKTSIQQLITDIKTLKKEKT